MYSVFSTTAAQLRNEGGLKASFASVSSVLRLVYWLVWLSCLTVFTCSCLPLQDDSQQSAAAQQEQQAQTYLSLFVHHPQNLLLKNRRYKYYIYTKMNTYSINLISINVTKYKNPFTTQNRTGLKKKYSLHMSA